MPRVRVGSLDSPEWESPAALAAKHAPNAPSESTSAYCTWFAATFDAAVRTELTSKTSLCQEPEARATCDAKVDKLLGATGDFRALAWLSYDGPVTSNRDLVLVAKDGAFATVDGASRDRCEIGDVPHENLTLVSATEVRPVGAPAVVAVVTERAVLSPNYSYADSDIPHISLYADVSRDVTLCRAASGGDAGASPAAGTPPKCEPKVKIGEFHGDVGKTGVVPPFETWGSRRAWRLLPTGVIMVGGR